MILSAERINALICRPAEGADEAGAAVGGGPNGRNMRPTVDSVGSIRLILSTRRSFPLLEGTTR
jgi:hypothetical protein